MNAAADSLSPYVSRRAAQCLALTIVGVLTLRLLVSILLHPLRIGWDPSLHLMCATLICQGKLPYVDMFDVNPPLIWYLNTLPAFLSGLTSVPLPLAFNLFLLFMFALSGLMASYIIVCKLDKRDILVNLGVVLGLLASNFFLTVDFGQREEIFVLLFMPFFFLRAARWQGGKTVRISTAEAVFFGLIGAAGLFMKHYFLLNLLCVEFFFFFSARGKTLVQRLKLLFAAENLSMAVFGLIYVGHFFFLPQAVRHNYFDFLLPAFSKGYYFWDTTVPNNLSVPYKRNVFFLLTASGAASFAIVRRYPIVGAILSFSLAGLVVYLVQFKGWAYQDIPVLAGGFMLVGALLGAFVTNIVARLSFRSGPVDQGDQGKTSRSQAASPANVAAYAISVLVAGFCLVSASDEMQQVGALPQFDMSRIGYSGNAPMLDVDTPYTKTILENSKTGDPILFISNAVSPGFPISMQLRRVPASRHLHVCILSVLQYIRSSSVRDDLTKRLLDQEPVVAEQLGQDILNNKPAIVFFQTSPCRDDYLSKYDFVKKYLSDYKIIETIDNFAVYKRNTR